MNVINRSLGFIKTNDSKFKPNSILRVLEYSDTACFVLHDKKRVEIELSLVFQDFECYLKRKENPKVIAKKIVN